MQRSNTDAAVSIVLRCLGKLDSKKAWKKIGFEQIAYTRWAYIEIIDYLKSHRDSPPLYAVEELRNKMDEYACLNPESSVIFSVAYDACEEIIDMLV